MKGLDCPPNAIEQAVDYYFSEANWRADRGIRMAGISLKLAGLHYDYAPEYQTNDLILNDPAKSWVSLLYGMRAAPDHAGRVVAETVGLNTMISIHKVLGATVLAAEQPRTGLLVTPPYPEKGADNWHNNNRWLEVLAAGRWPIMAKVKYPQQEADYTTHDRCEDHVANNMLAPRERQALVGAAAECELTWRLEQGPRPAGASRFEWGMLLFDGEDAYDREQYCRSAKLRSKGISKLDSATDDAAYVNLLHYLSSEPDRQPAEQLERLDSVLAKVEAAAPDYKSHQVDDPRARDLLLLDDDTITLANFVYRHRYRRNATLDEIIEAKQDFRCGIARVAETIRGNFKPPAELKLQPAPGIEAAYETIPNGVLHRGRAWLSKLDHWLIGADPS